MVLGVERRDRGVGVQLGVDGAGVTVRLSAFPYSGCGEVVTYQTPRHQVLGLNHNTANYLLLTRKNEHGPHMEKKKKKIGLSGRGDTLIA